MTTMRTTLAAAAAVLTLTAPAVAATISYGGVLGPEAPGATGSGNVLVLYDNVLHALDISTSFAGLSAPTTIAHIHCCLATPGTGTAGVAVTPGTLPGFPTGLTSGSFSVHVDLTQAAAYTGSFLAGAGGGTLAGAEAALVAAMGTGRAYFNIHTSAFPNGEIRAFIAPIPEPSTYALMALGLATLVGSRRWRAGQAQRA